MKTYTHLTDEEFLREVEHVTDKAYINPGGIEISVPRELMTEIVKRLKGTNWEEEIKTRKENEANLEQTIEKLEERVEDLTYYIKDLVD